MGLEPVQRPLGAFDSWRPTEWHHVRYTVLPLAMVLAAGVIGYADRERGCERRRGGGALLAAVWIAVALGSPWGMRELSARMARIPVPISTAEARAIWYWIRQVGPDDGVLATYEVTAPLSRKRLFSYILDQNKPAGFPTLGPEFQWVFVRNKDYDVRTFLDQGFDLVHNGEFLTVLRRLPSSGED